MKEEEKGVVVVGSGRQRNEIGVLLFKEGKSQTPK